MLKDTLYTIAKLATKGRDRAEGLWWREADTLTDGIGDLETIFRDILEQVEVAKELA